MTKCTAPSSSEIACFIRLPNGCLLPSFDEVHQSVILCWSFQSGGFPVSAKICTVRRQSKFILVETFWERWLGKHRRGKRHTIRAGLLLKLLFLKYVLSEVQISFTSSPINKRLAISRRLSGTVAFESSHTAGMRPYRF